MTRDAPEAGQADHGRHDVSGAGCLGGRSSADDHGGRVGRRPVLAALGLSALGSGLVGTVEGSTYGDVVNVVDEGADPDGDESVTPVLEHIRRQYGDDTLVKFPDGRYYMDEQFRYTGFSNFGLHGSGATLVPADYHDFDGPQYRLFKLGVDYAPGRNLEFAGFDIDQRAPNTGIRVIEAFISNRLEVRDIDVVGYHDSGTWGPAFFAVTDSDGTGVVDGFRVPDGGQLSANAPGDVARGPTGILLNTDHLGSIRFRDCIVGGFPDNGLYASTYGTVRVEAGRYYNSEAASIRLRGYRCLVRGADVVVDANPQDFVNQRGIRLDAGTGFRIEDVDMELSRPNGHAITVRDKVGDTRIENTEIHVGDRTNHAIVIQAGADDTDIVETNIEMAGGGNAVQIEDGPGTVVCQEMQIWGMASGSTFRHAVRANRDGTEVRAVKIWQPGPDKRRAVVFNGDDCLLYGSLCRTREYPVLVNGTGAWIEDNTLEPYDDSWAIKLNDSSANVTIKGNTLYDGVLDRGSAGLRMYGNKIL